MSVLKRILLLLVVGLLTTTAFAKDARQTYSSLTGHNQSTKLASSVCGVDDSGIPILCGTSDTDARIRYEGLDGFMHSTTLISNVCSVDSDGVPQLCDTSSEGTSTSALNIVDNLITSSGTWPTVDPLVAGQAWVSGGVMMLSTGSAAKPTFDGSGLANVATLDANGNVTAPILSNSPGQTGALQVNGQINAQGIGYFISSMAQIQGIISGSSKKWTLSRRPQDTYTKLNSYNGSSWQAFSFNDDGTLDSGVGVFANLGAAAPFTVSVSAPTITATASASVPDTSTSDSSTAALNTESAVARFALKTDESNFATDTDLAKYLTLDSAQSTYLTITDAAAKYLTSSALSSYLTTSAAATTYAPLASPALTGTPTSPTPATSDNSTNVATTAFVNNAFQSIEYSVQGDISTSGSSIQIPFGTSGLYAKFAYTGSGSASMTFCATSDTLSPVDIRRNSIWGSSGVETYTLDNGSVSSSCVTADSTVYTQSNDSSAYFIRVGGTVYFLTVWASNSGARAFMGVHKMI